MDSELDGYVIEIARFFPRQGRWTEEDYFALPETNTIVELSHGRLIVSPSPDDRHQTIIQELLVALRMYVQRQGRGKVRISAFDVRLGPELIRQPDVLFVWDRTRIDGKKYLDGAPDWAAEAISPGTRKEDEVEKMFEYAQAGIPEYWLIDPKDQTVRVYHLLEGGNEYTLAASTSMEQTAQSVTLPGFSIELSSLFPKV